MDSPWNSPGHNTRVGSLSLLQWIFLTQESNQGLLHCRQILYQLSYRGSPMWLEYVLISYWGYKKLSQTYCLKTKYIDYIYYQARYQQGCTPGDSRIGIM